MPERPRRSWLGSILATLLILAVLITLGGAATTVLVARGSHSEPSVTFVENAGTDGRVAALRALLDRRAKAVLAKDKAAFLADVDNTDAAVLRKQEELFANLTVLPLAEFSYQLEERVNFDTRLTPAQQARYHSLVRTAGVTVRYRIDGLDEKAVATPWVPVFGVVDGAWRVAGELTDAKGLPMGANGQPWDAGAIKVVRSNRVLAVLSADDAGRSSGLLTMAETGVDRVLAVRPGGWPGKVLLTAVQDSKIFEAYFTDSPDRVSQVAAVAVPYYSQVPAWHTSATYTATRVVFNPQQLGGAADAELLHDLTHEFTHVAMGPVTVGATPLWLVEGFAEYVAFKPEQVRPQYLRSVLSQVKPGLPENKDYYADALHYVVSWQACKMIAERYGEAKLMALYEAFQTTSNMDATLKRILGVDLATLTTDVDAYVAQARASAN